MTYKKKKQINELKEGEPVEDIFVVKLKRGVSQYANGFRIILVLSDSSGASLGYTYWGNRDEERIKKLYEKIKEDSVILIHGKINTYQGKLQLNSDVVEEPVVLNPEEYEVDFIRKSTRDIEELNQEIKRMLANISDSDVKELVLKIYFEIENNFKSHAGGITIHHSWVGGLLEHTYEVMKICEECKNLFGSLNNDLLIAGAFLHDIGKLEELKMTTRIKAGQKGQLVGHLALGLIKINEYLKESNLDELTKNKILHIITSHHGKEEFGSPKKPMFPEAMVIYYADELSSKVSAMVDFKEEMKNLTDGDFAYYKLTGTNIFLK